MYLVFDTETTGLPLWKEPSDHPDQPHVVDIAWTLFAEDGSEIERFDAIINPGPHVVIPDELAALHGITTERARDEGVAPLGVFERFVDVMGRTSLVVGHNVSFDLRMMRIMGARHTGEKYENDRPTFCTMRSSTNVCRILKEKPRTDKDWKWPNLTEAVRFFFDEEHGNAHRARPDCDAAGRIFFRLKSMEN